MEPRHLTGLGLPPIGPDIAREWLVELDTQLPPLRRRRRREILLELADGLACGIEERTRRGQPVEAAARAAVAELGDPRIVAAAFARQRGATATHRLGLGLILTGPFVGLTWVVAYANAGLPWPSQIAHVLSTMPQYPPILAVTVAAAFIAITAAGWPARYLVVPPRVVSSAAMVAVIGCMAGDLSLVSVALLGGGGGSGPGVLAVAIAASIARLTTAGWAGWRIARLRTVGN